VSSTPAPLYRVERLADHHDRASFVSGNLELDSYLRLHAGQDLKRKVAVPFLMLDQSGVVVGYYTLSAYGIRFAELPLKVVKKLPKYPLLPATLLGRLAISREHQGKKLGRILLMNALQRSWRNTTRIASIGVVVDAYDERARVFYLHHEFVQLMDHPNKLFISMLTVEKAFAHSIPPK
jgi:predicted GNAT family N-acyltransferase